MFIACGVDNRFVLLPTPVAYLQIFLCHHVSLLLSLQCEQLRLLLGLLQPFDFLVG